MAATFIQATYGNISENNKVKILLKGHAVHLHASKSSTKWLDKTINKLLMCVEGTDFILDQAFKNSTRHTLDKSILLRKSFARDPDKLTTFLKEPLHIKCTNTLSKTTPMTPKQYLPEINQSPVVSNNHDLIQMNLPSPIVSIPRYWVS